MTSGQLSTIVPAQVVPERPGPTSALMELAPRVLTGSIAPLRSHGADNLLDRPQLVGGELADVRAVQGYLDAAGVELGRAAADVMDVFCCPLQHRLREVDAEKTADPHECVLGIFAEGFVLQSEHTVGR